MECFDMWRIETVARRTGSNDVGSWVATAMEPTAQHGTAPAIHRTSWQPCAQDFRHSNIPTSTLSPLNITSVMFQVRLRSG